MPHHVDFDSIHQNIFVVLNLCYASEKFAQTHDLSAVANTEVVNGSYYFRWLKYTLSERLIDTAIKTRVILDMIRAQENEYRLAKEKYPFDVRELDKSICESVGIGVLSDSDLVVSLREACNKIIHAEDIRPVLEEGEEEHTLDEESDIKRQWEYWSGQLELSGTNRGNEWNLSLYVDNFCSALEEFISRLEEEVDWSEIHRDDWYQKNPLPDVDI